MRRILLSLFLLLAFSSASAQVLPSEKLFFVSDQSRYRQGDTAWTEGRVMQSDNDTVMVRQKLVCDSVGNFITRIPIEYEGYPGYHYLISQRQGIHSFEYDIEATRP